jgi:dTDP-4-amino-4,6-dideoxygalactose transaminase
MKKIHSLGQEYGFKIIEDASHAIGGKYLDQPIGGCQYSNITVFSFHPVKIITTAEGGLATTNNKKLSERMQLFRSHGVTRDPELMTKKAEGDWYYQQVDLGLNYRMNELQAALGISQMNRLDEFVSARHQSQKRYDEFLKNFPITTPYQDLNNYSALHLYPIQIQIDKVKGTRKEIFEALRKNDIGVNVHYIPVHTQPYYENMGFKKGDYPNAENYYERVISIPMFQGLTIEMQDEVINALKKFLV